MPDGTSLAARRYPPGARALAELARRTTPGARVVRTRRLRGGLGCRSDLVVLESPSGARTRLTLRRFVRQHTGYNPRDQAAREFALLGVLDRAGVCAPRPVWLDADGDVFGAPAMALTYIDGRPLLDAPDTARLADGLARALVAVHAVSPGQHDLRSLPVGDRDDVRRKIARRRAQAEGAPLTPASLDVTARALLLLERRVDSLTLHPPCLIHDDYWPGNVVWNRGRVAAVIDWTGAMTGDPRQDVSECRLGLIISHGPAAADAFSDAYERATGEPLADLAFFDLLRGLAALRHHRLWLEGYVDFGLDALDSAAVERGIRAFLERALAGASR